jgi:hypothetical protein
MCHAIVWYHAVCQHKDESQTFTIPCYYATATGYNCLPHYQLVFELPLSGECCTCKGERRWQLKQKQRKHADNLPVVADVDDIGEFDVDEIIKTDIETGLRPSSQIANDGYMHLWIGGADSLAIGSQVDHSDSDGGLGGSWYDSDGDDGNDEDEVDLEELEDLLFSSPCSEMEFGRDGCESDAGGDFPDSPILGYSGSWDVIIKRNQSMMSKSQIPVPVSRDKLLQRVWMAHELELFEQLTF